MKKWGMFFAVCLVISSVFIIGGGIPAKAEEHAHDYAWACTPGSATQHELRCTVCGKVEYREEHWSHCSSPDTCAVCHVKDGNEFTVVTVEHRMAYAYASAAEHQFYCPRCGEYMDEREAHWSRCNQRDVCVCGANLSDGITLEYYAHVNLDHVFWEKDANEHWKTCPDCGEKAEQEAHTFDNGGVCTVCLYAKKAEDEHEHAWSWKHDREFHWEECSICGLKGDSSFHSADCLHPDVCVECEATLADGIEIALLEHHGHYSPWETTAVEHWRTCLDCGEKLEQGVHRPDAKGECKLCGYHAEPDEPVEPLPAPKYSVTFSFDREEMTLTGAVAHQAGTADAPRVYVRITYFMADGTYMVVSSIAEDDGSFESMNSGSVVHIALQVTNNAKIRPGEFERMGGTENDVK